MELQASGRIQASKVSSSWSFEYEKSDGDVESPDETSEESSLEQLFLLKLDALKRRINFWNKKLQEYVHLVKGARAAVWTGLGLEDTEFIAWDKIHFGLVGCMLVLKFFQTYMSSGRGK